MGRISRGWALTKQSWRVLTSDRSLVVFPILSAIFATVALLAVWVPTAVVAGVFETQSFDENNPVYYVGLAVTIYVSTFIAIFFNVALASCAARSMRGEDTSVGQGIAAAARLIGPILGWTLVAGTVGLVLQIIEDKVPMAGKIAVWIADAAWAIATFFVVPVIALEGSGPWRSLKRSAAVVRARWGEGATGAVAISAVTTIIVMAIVITAGAGGFALAYIGMLPLAIAIGGLAVAAVIAVAIISSALSGIFRVAVYQYAVTGEAPAAFDPAMVQAAFEGHGRRAPR